MGQILPAVNAILNGTTALLLLTGWLCIRRGRVRAHVTLMATAVVLSVLFLASYVAHHYLKGRVTTRFVGEPWLTWVYRVILWSHTLLAMAVVPLVIVTLRRALRNTFVAHRRIARVTLPIWLYVAVTGVAVYLLLYHASGAR